MSSNLLFLYFEFHCLKSVTVAWSKLDANTREVQQSQSMCLRLKFKGE